MSADQIVAATVKTAREGLQCAIAFLAKGTEGPGISNLRWSRAKLVEGGLEGTHSGAITMIDAAIKAYGQGNDNAAGTHAKAALERLGA